MNRVEILLSNEEDFSSMFLAHTPTCMWCAMICHRQLMSGVVFVCNLVDFLIRFNFFWQLSHFLIEQRKERRISLPSARTVTQGVTSLNTLQYSHRLRWSTRTMTGIISTGSTLAPKIMADTVKIRTSTGEWNCQWTCQIYYISTFQVGILQPVIYAGQSIATIYVLPLPTLSSFLEADIFHPNHMNGLSSSQNFFHTPRQMSILWATTVH